jgi:hypothetical protein
VLAVESLPLAWDAINSPDPLAALITKFRFPRRGLESVALARHAQAKHPCALIFFLTESKFAHYIEGAGTLIRTPVWPPDLAEIVTDTLAVCGEHMVPNSKTGDL